MAATMLQHPPAIQRYLTALEASLRKTPEMSPDEGLADALEFLQSEWEALECQPVQDDDLFQHFVRKFGAPEEVAAAYAAAYEPHPVQRTPAADTEHCSAAAATKAPGRKWQLPAVTCGIALVLLIGGAGVTWRLSPWTGQGASNSTVEAGPAWADRVVAFNPGNPQPTRSLDPSAALGLPDCRDGTREPDTYVSLGIRGQIILEFTGALFFDGDGPDLKIVEIGPLAEAVEVSVSSDGEHWLAIGCAKGAESTLDLAGQASPGDRFRFVRLVDLGTSNPVNNRWPGADIDAVAALHATRNQ